MASTDQRLAECIKTIKAGHSQKARQELVKLLKDNPHNDQAWLWLSICCDTIREKRFCVEKALSANPDNVKARQMLEGLSKATALPELLSENQQGQIKEVNYVEQVPPTEEDTASTDGPSTDESKTRSLLIIGSVVAGVAFFVISFVVLNLLLKRARFARKRSESPAIAQPTRELPATWTLTPEPSVDAPAVIATPSLSPSQSKPDTDSSMGITGEARDYMPAVEDLPEGFEWVPEFEEESPEMPYDVSSYTAGYQYANHLILQYRIGIMTEASAEKAFEKLASNGGRSEDEVLSFKSESLDLEVPYADRSAAFKLTYPGKPFPSEESPVHVVLIKYKNAIVRVDIGYLLGDANLKESEYYASIPMKKLLEK